MLYLRYFFCLPLTFSLFSLGMAQKMSTHRSIILKEGDTTVQFEIKVARLTIPARHGRAYHYYYQNKIYQTMGGYAGILLDGGYITFSSMDKRLLSQGQFLCGLKKGIWRYWHPNGVLAREERWKKGRLHGQFVEFDRKGNKSQSGRYRKGQLCGRLRTYSKSLAEEKVNSPGAFPRE
jgi:hypothetical protein